MLLAASPRTSKVKRDTESNLVSGLEHRNARTVERKTLKRLMPTAQSVVANVLQNIQLQVGCKHRQRVWWSYFLCWQLNLC